MWVMIGVVIVVTVWLLGAAFGSVERALGIILVVLSIFGIIGLAVAFFTSDH